MGELTAEGQKPPPPERVNELSRLRLQRLRDLCVEHLEAAYKAYRRGVELLAEPHRIEIRDILELSGGSSRYPADRRDEYDAVFNRCFPIDEHAEQEKNLLRYYNHLGSMPPFKSPNGERHPFEKSKTAFAPTFMISITKSPRRMPRVVPANPTKEMVDASLTAMRKHRKREGWVAERQKHKWRLAAGIEASPDWTFEKPSDDS